MNAKKLLGYCWPLCGEKLSADTIRRCKIAYKCLKNTHTLLAKKVMAGSMETEKIWKEVAA